MILALDTSADQCAVALIDGDRVWSKAETMTRGHAERLFPMIDEVLAEAGAGYDALSRVAVCTGPGSFTGLRVGVAAARGLALGCGIPAVGVSRFEAVYQPGTDQVCLPGRGGEIQVQDFGMDGASLGPPRLQRGEAENLLADPARIAEIGAEKESALPPAPLYLRPVDAAPSKDTPPPRIA